MFSMTPATVCPVWVAMAPARSATSAAAACGVVTTRISALGSSCATEMAMSPVPGGQVEEQGVKVAEVDVGEELLEGPVQHGSAPGHRLVAGDEHADGNDLHAVRHRREDHVVHPGGCLGDAHQGRYREAVDVRVHDAHAQALGRQGAGQVDGHRGLSHAALAAGHGKHLGQRSWLVERDAPLAAGAAELLLQRVALGLRHDLQVDVDGGDAGNAQQRRLRIPRDRVPERAAGDGEQHRQAHRRRRRRFPRNPPCRVR